jgi:hypothetical protein
MSWGPRTDINDDTMMEFRKIDYLIRNGNKFNLKDIFINATDTEEFYYFANMQVDSENSGVLEPPLNMNGFSNNMFDRGWYIQSKSIINPAISATEVESYAVGGYAGDKLNYQEVDFYMSDHVGTLTYKKNMFMAFGKGKKGKMEKHLIYNEYGRDENNNELFPDYLELSELRLDEYIKYVTDDGAPYLKITIPPSYRVANPTDQIPENGTFKYSSFQVWYFHEDSYKFVFGVNLTNTDIANGYVKIYISAVSNKDPRVYKSTQGILDGYVQNLLEPDAPEYGTGQYYKKIKKQ